MTTKSLLALLVCVLALGALGGSEARAQRRAQPAAQPTQQERNEEEARGLFLAGRAALERGRYEEALSYFERSYELSGHPELLYNVALCNDRLRNDRAALDAFERYLELVPESPHAADVRARVATLRAVVERQGVHPDEAPALVEGGAATTPDLMSVGEPSEDASSASSSTTSIVLLASGGTLVAGAPSVARHDDRARHRRRRVDGRRHHPARPEGRG